jgi:hypothetical protein
MITPSVTAGRADRPIRMVPATANSMRSSPALELASRMACRSEPAPESASEVTVNVAAARARRGSSVSRRG